MSYILVVDDDPDSRTSFVEILQGAGMQVDTVADADEAAGKIKANNYELILVDLLLPGEINGMGLIESFRSLVTQSYIIAYSAYSGRNIAEKALRAGANGFIPKAYIKDNLLQTVTNVLTGPNITGVKPVAANPVPLVEAQPAAPMMEVEPEPPRREPAQDAFPLLFINIPKQNVHDLMALAQPHFLHKGETFALSGQQDIVTVGRGQIDLTFRNKKVAQINIGEAIGEASFFDKSRELNYFTLVARNDCILYLFKKSDLKKYFKDHGRNLMLRFAANIVWSVSNTMMKCIEESCRADEATMKNESLFENRNPWSAEVLTN
jgi:CheY-like chemotaxis protein